MQSLTGCEMTERELRRLNRSALIELLIEQMEENKSLEEKIQGMQEELESRSIVMTEAGSIADASLRLNHVFDAADQAAAQYLENVQAAYERCESVLMAANQRAAAIVQNANIQAQEIIDQAERESAMTHLVEEVVQPEEKPKPRRWPWHRKRQQVPPQPAPEPETTQREQVPPVPGVDDLFDSAFQEMMSHN